MADTRAFTPEEREAIIRAWVVALPSDRKQICKDNGISDTLPYYWRTRGYWPKDLILPPARKMQPDPEPAPAPAPAKPEPANALSIPAAVSLALAAGMPADQLTPEQRKVLGAYFKSLGTRDRLALAKQTDISRSTFYHWAAGRHLAGNKPGRPLGSKTGAKTGAKTRTRAQNTREEKLAAVAEIDRMRAAGIEVLEACARLGIKNPSSYQKWRNGIGLGRTGVPLAKGEQQQLLPEPAKAHTERRDTVRRVPDEERQRRVAAVNALREGGMTVREALQKVPGISPHSYHVWGLEIEKATGTGRKPAQKGQKGQNGLVPASARKTTVAVALSNRALQKANGGPRVASGVGELVKRFMQELAAMGAEIQEIKNNGDGHCTVVVKHTEMIEI